MTETFSPAGKLEPAPKTPRIRVLARHPPYEPAPRRIPRYLLEHGGRIELQSSRHHLFILGDAAQAIDKHVGWGRTTADNHVEQGGLLIGHVYRDPARQLVYGVVGEALPAVGARSSTTFLEMSPEVWAEMLERLDDRVRDGLAELQVIGWYHTHPGELSVFMSDTDRRTQQRFFDRDWHFALVLNPQRRVYKAFQGRDASPCNVRIDEQARLPTSFFDAEASAATGAALAVGSSAGHASVFPVAGPLPRVDRPATTPKVLRRLRKMLRRVLRRRPSLSPTRPLELTLVEEDREAGLVKIRLDGWLRSADASRILDTWTSS